MILRDLNILKKINKKTKAVVQMTLTTYDEKLCKILEPKVATTKERFEVLEIMRDNKIPTVVWLDPILPFINDSFENIKGIMDYCIKAEVKGIVCFGIGLTLREGNREYFYGKLDIHFPGLKEKYVNTYGESYMVSSPSNDVLMKYIRKTSKENNILLDEAVFKYLSEFPETHKQMKLF